MLEKNEENDNFVRQLTDRITKQFENELKEKSPEEKVEYLKSFGFAVELKHTNNTAKDKYREKIISKYNTILNKILLNLSNIEGLKLENSASVYEFSVIVLYKDDSDIIICENSKELNIIYEFINEKLEESKHIDLNN